MKKTVWTEETDYLVIGSGAAGATAGLELALAGKNVIVLEEGGWHKKESFTEDIYGAMSTLFRDFGMQIARGKSITLLLDGCAVGGSTIMNGAIVHRLPESVYAEWSRDAGIKKNIPFRTIEKYSESLERELKVDRRIEKQLETFPVSRVLRDRHWSYNAMLRNAPHCRGTDRCLQGCPTGGKWSMEASFLPQMLAAGGKLYDHHRVVNILHERGKATGVRCANGKTLHARKAVILAAGALHSPRLLKKLGGGFRNSEIGKHFQCHLSVGITGQLTRPNLEVVGPPQGIEINEFQERGIKFATQPTPPELVLSRSSLVGDELLETLFLRDQFSGWMTSIRSTAEGSVSSSFLGGTSARFDPSAEDLESVRFSLYQLTEFLFDLGATRVFPGISGPKSVPTEINSRGEAKKLLSLPLDPRLYVLSAGHLFGTCRMGSDPATSVVSPQFAVHGVKQLYVVDASIFPTNTGVNPQHSIMALARHAANQIMD
jgi:choline dehydrogenase-like flavoprotein